MIIVVERKAMMQMGREEFRMNRVFAVLESTIVHKDIPLPAMPTFYYYPEDKTRIFNLVQKKSCFNRNQSK